jgi:DNA helicase HerA-like ATPase
MKTNNDYIIDNSIFRVWHVLSIEWRTIKISVDKWKNSSHILYKWDILQNISVWWYVKIIKWFIEMIWKIEWESVNEDKKINSNEYSNNKEKINRFLSVKLLWYIEDWIFTRWIRELPLVNNECFLLKRNEFNLIHNFVEKWDIALEIWELTYDEWQKINIWINSIFASHIWIFWNTWSWKSYTLAKVYNELFTKYKENKWFKRNSSFYFIDFNWEYIWDDTIIEKDYKNIYRLSTRVNTWSKYIVKNETIRDASFWSIFLEATEKTQMPFLNRAIKDIGLEEKLRHFTTFKELVVDKIISATSVSWKNIDKTITEDFLYELAYYIWDDTIKNTADYFRDNLTWWTEYYWFNLEWLFADWNKDVFKAKVEEKIWNISNDVFNTLTPIKKIWLTIIIKYYDEMIRWFSNREHLSPLIKRLEKRIRDLEKVVEVWTESLDKNISIISLRDVNIDIRKMIPMLICKELYESKKRDTSNNKSLHIIIDEAHNILSKNSERESEQWKDYRLETFEEIIKEWRKFGVFLTIASQRPSDISPTIISQLHNYFLHRLINNNDIIAVEKTISYLDKVSWDQLPILPTWSCILAWLFAQIPVIININKIDNTYKPNNETIKLTDNWIDEDIPF